MMGGGFTEANHVLLRELHRRAAERPVEQVPEEPVPSDGPLSALKTVYEGAWIAEPEQQLFLPFDPSKLASASSFLGWNVDRRRLAQHPAISI
ncbi:hypothetical protein CDV31_004339 [Fusarium ambrosium]|uniref:Uncharacterized protein n=1 Tax=Fusarium ambrosium TaxID=131363 RepID=A0A428URG5_9HYPO|nr:hypothetical protein CDV31_004339 [Fusarium ambrosium]